VLRYVLKGELPELDVQRVDRAVEVLKEFARGSWQAKPSVKAGKLEFPCVLEDGQGTRVAVWPIHPLDARPTAAEKQGLVAKYGLRAAVHTVFDLERRPFWVVNHLVN
jgi:hypothetical protein